MQLKDSINTQLRLSGVSQKIKVYNTIGTPEGEILVTLSAPAGHPDIDKAKEKIRLQLVKYIVHYV